VELVILAITTLSIALGLLAGASGTEKRSPFHIPARDIPEGEIHWCEAIVLVSIVAAVALIISWVLPQAV
jgi:hypothetical protein